MKHHYWPKALATLVAGLVCGYLMFLTQGAHGIGWFLFSLIVIWEVDVVDF